MSIGNLKDQGNKGNNLPYQLRMLQLLAQIDTSINNIPGVDFVTRTTTYQATAPGPGYSTSDILVRYDIIDIATNLVASTIWFNQNTQLQIATPTPGTYIPITPPSTVFVGNGAAGAAVNIQDGGNSITVDGSVSVSNLPAVQPVSGTVNVNQAGIWVVGATQTGGWSVGQTGTWNINNITGTISLPTGAATETTLGSVNTKLTSAARTPNLLRATGSGTIAPQVYSFSVANVGSLNGTILGQTIKPGETLNFDAGALNNYYAAGTITYNGTGTELVIIYNS